MKILTEALVNEEKKRKWKSRSKTGLPKPLTTSGNILKQDAGHHMFCVDSSFKAEKIISKYLGWDSRK